MIVRSLLDLIGNTPVVEFAGIYVKLESYNLTGSVKDRPALEMIEGLERRGLLKPGDALVEPTSGNTGISLAAIGAIKGYRVILVMPETMSLERRQIMTAYGAEITLTPGAAGMAGAIAEAQRLASQPGYIMPSQFTNPDNVRAHELTTAKEIIADFPVLDYVVAGIGTGGTVTGLARVLKKHYPDVKVIGVEPRESAVITTGVKGAHGIQGIGAGFIPEILATDLLDEVVTVATVEAKAEARRLSRLGLFLGISAGAAIKAALDIRAKVGVEKVILAIAPDNGFKYLSTDVYA